MAQGVSKTLYYAVNKDGRGNIFTSQPVRNEHFGIWEGTMESCFSEVIEVFAADGLSLPNIKFADAPHRLTLAIDL